MPPDPSILLESHLFSLNHVVKSLRNCPTAKARKAEIKGKFTGRIDDSSADPAMDDASATVITSSIEMERNTSEGENDRKRCEIADCDGESVNGDEEAVRPFGFRIVAVDERTYDDDV